MSGPAPMNLTLIWTSGLCPKAKELETVLFPAPCPTYQPALLTNDQSQNVKATCSCVLINMFLLGEPFTS